MTCPRADAGFAVPAMLALLVVMALLVGSIIETARGAQRLSLDRERRAVDFYAAEAGVAAAGDAIARAVEVGAPAPTQLSATVESRVVSIAIVPASESVDLNAADNDTLTAALQSAGAGSATAATLAAAIVSRRAASPWQSTTALAGVGGLDDRTAQCLEAVLTPHGGRLREAVTPASPTPATLGAAYLVRAAAPPAGGRVATVHAAIRLTGNPARPLLVHEWRRSMEGLSPAGPPCFVSGAP